MNRTIARAALTIGLALTASAATTGATAQAVTIGSPGGSVGGSIIPGIVGGELCNWMNGPLYTGCVYSPTITSGAATAYRPAGTSAAQIVTLDFQVWRYDGTAWRPATSQRSQSTIPAGQASTNLSGLSRTTTNGYYRVTAVITWWTADARWLGRYDIGWNSSGDYHCRAPHLTCGTGPGWIRHGA